MTKEDRRSIDTTQQGPARYTGRSDYVGLCPTPEDAVHRAEYFARNPRAKKSKGVPGIDVPEIDSNDAEQAHITEETHELLMVHFTRAGLAYYSHWRFTDYGEAVLAKKPKNTAEASWDTWEFRDDLPLKKVDARDGTTFLKTQWMPAGWKPVPPVTPPPVEAGLATGSGILLDVSGRERILQLCKEIKANCSGTPQS